eukprot:gene6302-1124_t
MLRPPSAEHGDGSHTPLLIARRDSIDLDDPDGRGSPVFAAPPGESERLRELTWPSPNQAAPVNGPATAPSKVASDPAEEPPPPAIQTASSSSFAPVTSAPVVDPLRPTSVPGNPVALPPHGSIASAHYPHAVELEGLVELEVQDRPTSQMERRCASCRKTIFGPAAALERHLRPQKQLGGKPGAGATPTALSLDLDTLSVPVLGDTPALTPPNPEQNDSSGADMAAPVISAGESTDLPGSCLGASESAVLLVESDCAHQPAAHWKVVCEDVASGRSGCIRLLNRKIQQYLSVSMDVDSEARNGTGLCLTSVSTSNCTIFRLKDVSHASIETSITKSPLAQALAGDDVSPKTKDWLGTNLKEDIEIFKAAEENDVTGEDKTSSEARSSESRDKLGNSAGSPELHRTKQPLVPHHAPRLYGLRPNDVVLKDPDIEPANLQIDLATATTALTQDSVQHGGVMAFFGFLAYFMLFIVIILLQQVVREQYTFDMSFTTPFLGNLEQPLISLGLPLPAISSAMSLSLQELFMGYNKVCTPDMICVAVALMMLDLIASTPFIQVYRFETENCAGWQTHLTCLRQMVPTTAPYGGPSGDLFQAFDPSADADDEKFYKFSFRINEASPFSNKHYHDLPAQELPGSPYWNISSADDAVSAVQQLRQNSMIDENTAAVTTTTLFYNANLNLMGTLKVVFAISPTTQIPSDWARLVAEVFFILMTFGFLGKEIMDMIEASSDGGSIFSYFKDVTELFDLFFVILVLVSIGLYATVLASLPYDLEDMWILPDDHYDVSFRIWGYYFFMNGIVLIIFTFRILKYARFNARLAFLANTLVKAFPDLVNFGILFTLLVIGYSLCGFYFFGHAVDGFAKFDRSIQWMMQTVLDPDDYYELVGPDKDQSAGLFPTIFVWSFFIVVFFVMVNMFLAIVMTHYEE